MNRSDLIAFEAHIASTYRREAARRSKNPALKARLIELAQHSEARAEEFRYGPLFGSSEGSTHPSEQGATQPMEREQ